MGIKLLDKINAEQTAKLADKKFPEFRAGDIVRVSVRIKEGEKTRVQDFEGKVLAAATANESFGADGLLEAPQYTRPPVYRGMAVPQVLVDGDHGATASWRKRQAIDLTERRRPDLLAQGGTFAI